MSEECQKCVATARRCNRIEVFSFIALVAVGVLYFLVSLLAPHIRVSEQQTASLFTVLRYVAASSLGTSVGAGLCGA
jgi:hypothetical protein